MPSPWRITYFTGKRWYTQIGSNQDRRRDGRSRYVDRVLLEVRNGDHVERRGGGSSHRNTGGAAPASNASFQRNRAETPPVARGEPRESELRSRGQKIVFPAISKRAGTPRSSPRHTRCLPGSSAEARQHPSLKNPVAGSEPHSSRGSPKTFLWPPSIVSPRRFAVPTIIYLFARFEYIIFPIVPCPTSR